MQLLLLPSFVQMLTIRVSADSSLPPSYSAGDRPSVATTQGPQDTSSEASQCLPDPDLNLGPSVKEQEGLTGIVNMGFDEVDEEVRDCVICLKDSKYSIWFQNTKWYGC